MTYEVFAPLKAPSVNGSIEKNATFEVNTATFGDGYVQRSAKGINATADSWNLAWNNRSEDEINYIETFFRTKRGCIPFLYTMPGESEQLQWIVSSYKKLPVLLNGTLTGKFSISATFTRDYTP